MSPLLGLNEKERQLYNEAREFGETEFQPGSREWDSKSLFPRELMRKVGKKGYGGMMVSKDIGGSGYTRKECVVICEALAKSCVSTTALITVSDNSLYRFSISCDEFLCQIHNASTFTIDKFAAPELRNLWAPKLCEMEMMGSFCLTEPGFHLC
jgi:alkylation response protein AidB-like acyl-CoA dehydrogenase